jgi:hypothetical protein
MFDRRTLCASVAASALTAPWDFAAAMPHGTPAEPIKSKYSYVQLVPPSRPPKPEDLSDPKAFGQFLTNNIYGRAEAAGIFIDGDAQPEIQQAVARSVEASFRPQKGEIRKGATYDALPIEIRRVVVLRNFNTFADVLIFVGLTEGKKLTKELVTRVQGFICPLYPICTG